MAAKDRVGPGGMGLDGMLAPSLHLTKGQKGPKHSADPGEGRNQLTAQKPSFTSSSIFPSDELNRRRRRGRRWRRRQTLLSCVPFGRLGCAFARGRERQQESPKPKGGLRASVVPILGVIQTLYCTIQADKMQTIFQQIFHSLQ